MIVDLTDRDIDGFHRDCFGVLRDGGQADVVEAGKARVVVSHHGDFFGDAGAGLPSAAAHAEGYSVIECEDGGGVSSGIQNL